MKRKTALLILAVLWITIIPYLMLDPPFGPKAFSDTLGIVLAIGICACFFIGLLLSAVTGFTSLPRALIGIGLILCSLWVFGEKGRFAAQPVVKTDAVIMRFDDVVAPQTLYYRYQDTEGHWHTGEDYVDDLIRYNPWLEITLKPGNRVPVNYLKSLPQISRLTPHQHIFQPYLLKAILLLSGIIFLLGKWNIPFGNANAGDSTKKNFVRFQFSVKRKNDL